MFKWFAPLMLFAAKPEVLIRLGTAVILGAILFFGVWLFSNIALTFDALKNPYIAAAYGAVLFFFFVGIGMIAWLRLRRRPTPARLDHSAPPPAAPPLANEIVVRSAEEISTRWERGGRRRAWSAKSSATVIPQVPAPARTEPRAASPPGRAVLMVTGPAYTGKTALIAALVQAISPTRAETNDSVRLLDAGPIDGDEEHLAALVARAAGSDGVLFVVDQDLRAPEVAAITLFIATGKPLYVVLNKADQFNAADRDTILVSIRAKMPAKSGAAQVVSVAGAPSPIEREIEDARGAVRIELRRPSSDLRALTNLLGRIFPPAPGQTLRFECD
jgi:hypothetical protein